MKTNGDHLLAKVRQGTMGNPASVSNLASDDNVQRSMSPSLNKE